MQVDFHPLEQFCPLDMGVEGNASKRMSHFSGTESSFLVLLFAFLLKQ